MPRFRKKPVVIEAVQFKYSEWADDLIFADEFPKWLDQAFKDDRIRGKFGSEDYWYLLVETLNGWVLVGPDEWIVKGVDGEIYPCAPDIFEKTYEQVEDRPTIQQTDEPRLQIL